MIGYLALGKLVLVLRRAGYPLPSRMDAAREHVKRLVDKDGTFTVKRTAGGHRRVEVNSVLRFINDWKQEHPELAKV